MQDGDGVAGNQLWLAVLLSARDDMPHHAMAPAAVVGQS